MKTKSFSFHAKLENIAKGKQYFAFAVPAAITKKLGTVGPVPVSVKIKAADAFVASLYPVGGGRHYLRIRNKICSEAKIKKGDRVRIEITVRDRSKEIAIPPDLMKALKAKGAAEVFKAYPPGKKSFILRTIDAAVKPETRARKINAAVADAKQKRG